MYEIRKIRDPIRMLEFLQYTDEIRGNKALLTQIKFILAKARVEAFFGDLRFYAPRHPNAGVDGYVNCP